MHDAPKLLRHHASPIAINNTTVPHDETWPYITFLYEELGKPRNRLESRLQDRYKHCYEQSKSLGITSAQWIDCGLHKQVFALENTAWPRVIKLFCEPAEWERERFVYNKVKHKDHLLPHVYHEHYATCDWVEVIKSITELAHQVSLRNCLNLGYAKKIMKRHLKTSHLHNFGFYQDNLVWTDIGDCKWV